MFCFVDNDFLSFPWLTLVDGRFQLTLLEREDDREAPKLASELVSYNPNITRVCG